MGHVIDGATKVTVETGGGNPLSKEPINHDTVPNANPEKFDGVRGGVPAVTATPAAVDRGDHHEAYLSFRHPHVQG